MNNETHAAADSPRDKPKLVLIVEDEEPLAETISYVVRAAGYTPLVAVHGRHALELARTQRPAVLITDLMLPYLDGAGLIAALRADALATGEAPPAIILITAASRIEALAAGAEVVLRKPFHLADLEALLRRFLEPPMPVAAGREGAEREVANQGTQHGVVN
jgi:two-component system chemotaxis response regulator CheY